jgi:hypothetical protein
VPQDLPESDDRAAIKQATETLLNAVNNCFSPASERVLAVDHGHLEQRSSGDQMRRVQGIQHQ